MHSVGTAVEHHTLYQYQLTNTASVFMGQIQTETAYYQPNPPASLPFPPVAALSDPHLSASCTKGTGQCSGWGLRILDSQDISIYGAGLYSFFKNYNVCEFSPLCPLPSVSKKRILGLTRKPEQHAPPSPSSTLVKPPSSASRAPERTLMYTISIPLARAAWSMSMGRASSGERTTKTSTRITSLCFGVGGLVLLRRREG